MHEKVCRETGKRRYISKFEVELTLLLKGKNKKRFECRTYRCNLCNGWHLTSKKLRRSRNERPN